MRTGFTLIEISIVLVIIGLIVGGILVGQNLIAAAGVRATIAQIEKYNQAVNTFREKYGELPGDLNFSVAAQFGFAARGQYAGEGDGNGVIEGVSSNGAGNNLGANEGIGETTMFWVDLSYAKLIDGTFNRASSTVDPGYLATSSMPAFFPQAKLGQGNFVYVWSGGWPEGESGTSPGDSLNYFGISPIISITSGSVTSTPGLTVSQAYAIDSKIDDGLPQFGKVMALYDNGFPMWAGGPLSAGASSLATGGPTTAATPGSAQTCYDNGNVNGKAQTYSLEQSGGTGVNCALSFQFQ